MGRGGGRPETVGGTVRSLLVSGFTTLVVLVLFGQNGFWKALHVQYLPPLLILQEQLFISCGERRLILVTM